MQTITTIGLDIAKSVCDEGPGTAINADQFIDQTDRILGPII